MDELAGAALEGGLYELLRQRLQQVVLVPQPAAGADWTAVVPAGLAWELLAVTERFVTSAAVANRELVLQAKDASGNLLGQSDSPAFQTAGLTTIYSFERLRGYSSTVQAFVGQSPASAFVLAEGMSIGSATTLIDVADQHSKIVLVVRQWSLTDVQQAAGWYGRRSLTL